jgi:hypothetical protein
MASQQRVRRHNRGDPAQRPTAHPVRPRGEPSSVVISQPQAPPTQLSP